MAGIKFPFQKGAATFPALNVSKLDQIIDSVRSLLNIGPEELPMSNIGVNLVGSVFSNMSKIDQVILANSIRKAIIDNEPRMYVLGVDVTKKENVVIVEILFEVAGQAGVMEEKYTVNP